MHGRKYKTKLSIIIFIIFLISATIVMLSYFLGVTARQKRAQEEIILQEIANSFESVNSALLSAFHSLSYISQKQAIKQLSTSSTSQELSLNAIAAQKEIQGTMLAGGYLNYCQVAVAFISPEKTSVVTQHTNVSLDQYAQMIGLSTQQLTSANEELIALPFGHKILYSTSHSQNIYVNYLTTVSYSDRSLLFILSIDKENFKQAFSFSSCKDWMIFSNNNILFTKNEGSPQYKNYLKAFSEKSPELSKKISRIDFKFESDPVVAATFEEINWCFAAAYPEKSISLTDIFVLFLLPLLILFVFSLLPVQIISKYLYAPIDTAVLQLGGSSFTRGDEFDFIHQQTTLISQKAQKLDLYLKRNRLLLNEQVFKNALLGLGFSVDDVEDVTLKSTDFVVGLVETAEKLNATDEFVLIKNALREVIMPMTNMHYVNTSTSSFALIILSSDDCEARTQIETLFSQIGLSAHIQVRVTLSGSVCGIQNLPILYEQCNHLMEYRYYLADQMFVTAENAASVYYDGYYYPLKLETDLLETTIAGKDGSLKLLEEILHENLVIKHLSTENKRAFFFALLSTLNRIYQELHLSSEDGFIKVNDMLQITDFNKLESQVRSTFARVLWQTENRSANIKKDISDRMMDYIYNNYAHDISLDSIASCLNISPKYCSALFKKETGNTFKRFLNEYRIEQAKTLLKSNPNILISNLAEQVGFISANTFIQVFKQYTQTTPHQYANHFK